MSDWKPGDVAWFAGERVVWTDDNKFIWANTGLNCHRQDDARQTARPLAVIDPEDREQAVDLLRLYGQQYDSWTPSTDGPNIDRLQAALLEFASPTPPRPEEPTGLGAVVEDEDGVLWVRDKTTTTVAHWKRAEGKDGGRRYPYSHIATATVLSEGVE